MVESMCNPGKIQTFPNTSVWKQNKHHKKSQKAKSLLKNICNSHNF